METTFDNEAQALQSALAGRYHLETELGRGGMGIVYLARDVALERPVAIKLLPVAHSRDPAFRERFLREARIAARVHCLVAWRHRLPSARDRVQGSSLETETEPAEESYHLMACSED